MIEGHSDTKTCGDREVLASLQFRTMGLLKRFRTPRSIHMNGLVQHRFCSHTVP